MGENLSLKVIYKQFVLIGYLSVTPVGGKEKYMFSSGKEVWLEAGM